MKDQRTAFRALLVGVAVGVLAFGLGPVPAGEAQLVRHGMWVYGTGGLIDTDPDAASLIGFSSANHITELYLWVGIDVLLDTRLPNFVVHLKNSGLRVEALIDCTRTDPPTCADEISPNNWRARLDQVIAYNQGCSASQCFDGVHLDLEPWKQTGNDFSWVPELIGYYQYASSALEGSGLAVAAADK